MKNLKVKGKLFVGFGIVIVFMLISALLSVSGMVKLNGQIDVLISKTLTNTEYVWSMRRNLLSESRYLTMALLEESPQESNSYFQKAQEDVEKNIATMAKYKTNYSVSADKIQSLEDVMSREIEPRKKLHQTIQSNAPRQVSYQVFMDELQPLLYDQGVILREIGEEQLQISDEQIARVKKVYVGTLTLIIAAAILSILASIAIIIKLTYAIMTPLREIQNAANALAKGDFSVAIDYDSRDEFGTTCKGMQDSFTELKRVIHETANTMTQIAEGDFSVIPALNFQGEMQQIEAAQTALIKKMNTFFEEIKCSASQINSGSDQVSSGAQALAQGATEQASSIEELSASITEISNNVTENADSAKKANELATQSGEVAQATLEDMEDMLAAMNQISASAEDIGKVIKVIDDITFQTNILSLNAAVEAARAGVAGKGFAVVADEVRNLAQKSSESAKEITSLIERAIASVKQGEAIAQKTNQAFHGLAEKIDSVITTVNEIAVVSEEQASSINQITAGIDQIACVVQTNSATSEESAAASEELSSQATMLDSLVGQFQLAGESGMGYAPASRQDAAYSRFSGDSFSQFDKY